MYMNAKVYLLQSTKEFDEAYTYIVSPVLQDSVTPGVFVKVPFGRGNQQRDAVVWEILEQGTGGEHQYRLKTIAGILSEIQPLTAAEMRLAEKMKIRYLCSMGDCVRCMVPPPENRGVICNFVNSLVSVSEFRAFEQAGKLKNISQIKIMEYILERGVPVAVPDLIREVGCSAGVVKTLEKYGLVRIEKGRLKRVEFVPEKAEVYPALPLTPIQQSAFQRIAALLKKSGGQTALLHGVTGSGKTEIYLHLIAKVLASGGNAVVMVPEISLTPQMSARFRGRFGDRVAILHSRLSDHDRHQEWEKIKNGKASVALGARSAVFAPFAHVDLFILDEEHEFSYKAEETTPRYHAREIAEMRTEEGGLVLLGSATPSVETFYRARAGQIHYIPLLERVNRRPLPAVEVVDMRDSLNAGERGLFSGRLLNEIRKNLEKKEQTILFVHRRGFAGHLICLGCGKSLKCGKCNIPMTYHASTNRLICHYCGNTAPMPEQCPNCGSKQFDRRSAGTQRVEEELNRLFPEARVLRMDSDTAAGRDSHARILHEFAEGKADFLVGTQMIAKGHDFPNVTLAGVLSADTLLNMQDYRATERTFQLLTQVAGRSGRGEKEGRVIIQAYDVDNYGIMAAAAQDYEAFYRSEIQVRRRLYFPPFCVMAVVGITGLDDRAVYDYGVKCRTKLASLAANMGHPQNMEIFAPTRAGIPKINDKYRWRIFLKAPDTDTLVKLLHQFKPPGKNKHISGVVMDISPGSLF